MQQAVWRAIRQSIAQLGLRVERVPPAGRIRRTAPSGTGGHCVEFVGPSGVGKTYLCRQVTPDLARHWFFERHAKALAGHVPEDPPSARYLAQLYVARFRRLQDNDLALSRKAEIVARMSEVIRHGLVASSPGLPRGFVLDDGVAHFFAEQILETDISMTTGFLRGKGLIFLLPERPETAAPEMLIADIAAPQALREAAIYWALRDLAEHCQAHVLTLDARERSTNPGRVRRFFAQSFKPGRQGTLAITG